MFSNLIGMINCSPWEPCLKCSLYIIHIGFWVYTEGNECSSDKRKCQNDLNDLI